MKSMLHNLSEETKAIAVYGLIILLGIVLSIIVYTNITDVEKTTKSLVDNQIPTLALIRQTAADVTEQERLLYEYYATTDPSLYQDHYTVLQVKTIDDINALSEQFDEHPLIAEIYQKMAAIHQNATEFAKNIDDDETDWDLAREQLAQISTIRRSIDENLYNLERTTTTAVANGYQDTMTQIATTTSTVTWYSVSIFIIALVTGWYMRVYIKVSRKNKKLAEFTELNPHPIISVNRHGQVLYNNPATDRLLNNHSNDGISAKDLIPKSVDLATLAEKEQKNYITVEHELLGLFFKIEIHWLRDINVFDLHISDITAEKQAQQKLNFQAFHCPETGLQNSYRLRQQIESKVAARQPFALGLSEIREYSHLVSAHGVDSVKELIKVVAKRFEHIIDQSKHNIGLFRFDERAFGLLIEGDILPGAIDQQCRLFTQNMRDGLSTEFGEFNIEIDIGFCNYPEHSGNGDSLMQFAQLALDEAVGNEHGSYFLYKHELSDRLNNNLKLINWLKSAISNNELYMVYQPQLDIETSEIIGMESLIRWQHDKTAISPAEFIPIAEQTGLIVEIGEWLLHEACSTAKALADQGEDKLVLAVNISPRQFRHPNFLAMVKQVLQQTGLKPQQLELEITEGVILYNESETINLLQQLKSLDIQLSIDDFGTGYSSLSYLKQFPVDKLKIDQSFIKNLHTNDEDKAIVQAIIDLAKNLNLRTIAEGVEEAVHLDFLRSLNCDEIQGYHFSRPLKTDDFAQFINSHKLTKKVSSPSHPVI